MARQEEIRQSRAENQQRPAGKGQGKGMGKQGQDPLREGETPINGQERLRPEVAVSGYLGTDCTGALCAEIFRNGEQCVRLERSQIFHE